MARTLANRETVWLLAGVLLFIMITAGVAVVVGAAVKLLMPSVSYTAAVTAIASAITIWGASVVRDIKTGGWK